MNFSGQSSSSYSTVKFKSPRVALRHLRVEHQYDGYQVIVAKTNEYPNQCHRVAIPRMDIDEKEAHRGIVLAVWSSKNKQIRLWGFLTIPMLLEFNRQNRLKLDPHYDNPCQESSQLDIDNYWRWPVSSLYVTQAQLSYRERTPPGNTPCRTNIRGVSKGTSVQIDSSTDYGFAGHVYSVGALQMAIQSFIQREGDMTKDDLLELLDKRSFEFSIKRLYRMDWEEDHHSFIMCICVLASLAIRGGWRCEQIQIRTMWTDFFKRETQLLRERAKLHPFEFLTRLGKDITCLDLKTAFEDELFESREDVKHCRTHSLFVNKLYKLRMFDVNYEDVIKEGRPWTKNGWSIIGRDRLIRQAEHEATHLMDNIKANMEAVVDTLRDIMKDDASVPYLESKIHTKEYEFAWHDDQDFMKKRNKQLSDLKLRLRRAKRKRMRWSSAKCKMSVNVHGPIAAFVFPFIRLLVKLRPSWLNACSPWISDYVRKRDNIGFLAPSVNERIEEKSCKRRRTQSFSLAPKSKIKKALIGGLKSKVFDDILPPCLQGMMETVRKGEKSIKHTGRFALFGLLHRGGVNINTNNDLEDIMVNYTDKITHGDEAELKMVQRELKYASKPKSKYLISCPGVKKRGLCPYAAKYKTDDKKDVRAQLECQAKIGRYGDGWNPIRYIEVKIENEQTGNHEPIIIPSLETPAPSSSSSGADDPMQVDSVPTTTLSLKDFGF